VRKRRRLVSASGTLVKLSFEYLDINEGTLGQNDLNSINLFAKFFREFWSNFEELSGAGLNFQSSFELRSNKVVARSRLGIGRHRLKGYFADYRHFSLPKEPTYYFRVSNIVGKICRDERLHRILKLNKISWGSASTLAGWHNSFTADDIVDAMFNEEVFHAKRISQDSVSLKLIRSKLDDASIMHEVTFIIYRRMLVVRNLNFIVSPIQDGRMSLKLPLNDI
jgi:hypothetical protein